MISDAFWFAFFTLLLPHALDQWLVYARYYWKYKMRGVAGIAEQMIAIVHQQER